MRSKAYNLKHFLTREHIFRRVLSSSGNNGLNYKNAHAALKDVNHSIYLPEQFLAVDKSLLYYAGYSTKDGTSSAWVTEHRNIRLYAVVDRSTRPVYSFDEIEELEQQNAVFGLLKLDTLSPYIPYTNLMGIFDQTPETQGCWFTNRRAAYGFATNIFSKKGK